MRNFLIVFLLFLAPIAHGRPTVVFDMDHTLTDPVPRMIVILHDVGLDLGIPELLNLKREQVESLRDGDFSKLGVNDPVLLEKVFGNRKADTHRNSPFGKRLYTDASYLKHDTLIAGAPEFVDQLVNAVDAEVLYLTGRTHEYFEQETVKQLENFNFPGFGNKAALSPRATLILMPKGDPREVEDFKGDELLKILARGSVVFVADDSGKNVRKFRQILPATAVIVRPQKDLSSTSGLGPNIDPIIDYVSDPVTIKALIMRAQSCAQLLAKP